MKKLIFFAGIFLLTSCSPRDVLSRRLAADLIATSDRFKASQTFVLQTGIISSHDYLSTEYLVLQHHGWISASNVPCPAGLAPPPCWDILLSPSGVETVEALLSAQEISKPSFAIPAARRELVAVTGISKQGSVAEVDFTWRWNPLNEIGAALYSSDMRYKSIVGFRDYDDGWRLATSADHLDRTLEDALENAEPAP
jgi:hypothetical protein